MATSGLVANWVADTARVPVGELIAAAGQVTPGAEGLVLLPYFAGERSPVFDPGARGVALGLTLAHTPAHLMRAALEAVAMGVRHNLEAFDSVRPAGSSWRAVAVGGGAAGAMAADRLGCLRPGAGHPRADGRGELRRRAAGRGRRRAGPAGH